MGRLIDVYELGNVVMLNKSNWGIFATSIDQLVEGLVSQVQTADAIPKAEYEAQLKADLVAILTAIQTEIEETGANITYQENKDRKGTWGLRKASEIIDKYKESEYYVLGDVLNKPQESEE